MSTKIHLSSRPRRIAAAIITAAVFMSVVILAEASSPFDIEFPIPELGNCAGKTECKAYCENSENEEACHAFAAKHGLGETREEVDRKFRVIEEDGGPGGCAANSEDPRKSCEEYCGKSENMRACVAYAKDHGLMDPRELEEAEKVINALNSGVKLPAACTNERSCKMTCEEPKDIETARQCFAFAEAAGLLPPGVTPEKAEKMFKAIEEGRAPFKSPRDFEQCENPPSDEIFEKCINFALENDLIPPEEAEMIRKTGGKGPGGCRGKEQCESYCEEHQDECFAFAEEHDLVREVDKERMREGIGKFKEVLDNAPPEVAECLKGTVGAEVLDQIAAGTKPPSRELGEKMHQCFERFFSQGRGQFEGRSRAGEGMGEFHPPEGFAPGREGQMMGGFEGEESPGPDGRMPWREGPGFGESGFPPEEIQRQMLERRGEIEERMKEEGFRMEGGGQYPYPPQGESRDGGFYQGGEGGTYSPPAGSYDQPPDGGYQGGTGEYHPPEGSYTPPPSDGSSGSYAPPPSGESAPPPPASESTPSSLFFFPIGMNHMMASVLNALFGR